MEILYLMILCSVSLALVFLGLFIYGMKKGHFDDSESPAVRMLFDSEVSEEKQEVKKDDKNLELTQKESKK